MPLLLSVCVAACAGTTAERHDPVAPPVGDAPPEESEVVAMTAEQTRWLISQLERDTGCTRGDALICEQIGDELLARLDGEPPPGIDLDAPGMYIDECDQNLGVSCSKRDWLRVHTYFRRACELGLASACGRLEALTARLR